MANIKKDTPILSPEFHKWKIKGPPEVAGRVEAMLYITKVSITLVCCNAAVPINFIQCIAPVAVHNLISCSKLMLKYCDHRKPATDPAY